MLAPIIVLALVLKDVGMRSRVFVLACVRVLASIWILVYQPVTFGTKQQESWVLGGR